MIASKASGNFVQEVKPHNRKVRRGEFIDRKLVTKAMGWEGSSEHRDPPLVLTYTWKQAVCRPLAWASTSFRQWEHACCGEQDCDRRACARTRRQHLVGTPLHSLVLLPDADAAEPRYSSARMKALCTLITRGLRHEPTWRARAWMRRSSWLATPA